ncbi:MAG: exodeoxyribonuclease III [Clostridia bacterium]
MRLISWNVNGFRASLKKGFLDWLAGDNPDIACLQETKASPDQLPQKALKVEGYSAHFSAAEKKGYSGVAVYTQPDPLEVSDSTGDEYLDAEGRLLVIRYPEFTLYNVYFPNGKASSERLAYKMEFYRRFLDHVRDRIAAGEELIVCGDVNTAHREIDLARPAENSKISGFLPREREWIDRFLEAGFYDSFRQFETSGGHYSWWDLRTRARERNVGWRIDYVFVTEGLRRKLRNAFILPEVYGSDHCPVGIEVDI